MTNIKVIAYSVASCGYYKYGNKVQEFGSLSEILDDLISWSNGKLLHQTKTFLVRDDADVLPVYCFDIKKSRRTNNFLLVTWNEVPAEKGGVQTASAIGTVGTVDVSLTEIGQNHIPGFPSYFYFLPNRNMFFSLRPEGIPYNGHRGLKGYLSGYIQLFSKYVVRDALDYNKILGYAIPGQPYNKLFPRFSSFPKKMRGAVDFIRDNLNDIRKIVRDEKISVANNSNGRMICDVFLRYMGLPPSYNQDEVGFRYEMDFHPDMEQLDRIIERGIHDDIDSVEEVRTGFKIKGNSNIFWLDKSLAKGDFQVNTEKDEYGILNSLSFLNECDENIDRLIGIAEHEN